MHTAQGAGRSQHNAILGSGRRLQNIQPHSNSQINVCQTTPMGDIFSGDFHTLQNYQEALMKIYWDAGLKDIASKCGYRGETLTHLGKCSNFSITFFSSMGISLLAHVHHLH